MNTFWSWLDAHPAAYVVPAAASAGLLVWQAWTAPATPEAPSFRSRWLFPLLLLLTLVAWRWPSLANPEELNPDESQFIAGALTLRHDPIFWQSVDGKTSGPLISYALVPISWLGLPIDYLTARTAGLLALWFTFAAAFWQLCRHYHRRAASLGLLPALLFFATVTDANFNHYSSELVPIALLSAAGLGLLRPATARGGPGSLFWGAFLAGLMPWAKLQAMPLGAAMIGWALFTEWRDRRVRPAVGTRMVALFVGGLLPSVLAGALIVGAGIWTDFYRNYIVQNLIYAEPVTLKLFAPGSQLRQATFAIWGGGVVIGLALTAAIAAWSIGRCLRPLSRALLTPLFVWLPAAGFCVLFPGRDFLHYFFLLVPPLLLVSGAAVGEIGAAGPPRPRLRQGLAVGLPLIACALLALLRASAPLPPTWGKFAEHARQPFSQLGAIARLLCRDDPTLAVWGWQHDVYVEAQARQGTRSAYCYWEIVQHAQRDYIRELYRADFAARRPAVFVDAVGESTFFFRDRARNGHESFPALAAIVARDYCLVAELHYARIYARRDHLRRTGITQAQIWQAFLSGRPSDYLQGSGGVDLNSQPLPKDTVNGHFVLSLRPPASASWTLTGRERELTLGFGYIPPAAEQAEGDGTGLTATLRLPDGTAHTLLQVTVDPAHRPKQRGHQSARIILPPALRAGSVLTLASSAGPAGNDAWDWLYMGPVAFFAFDAFLPHQFPAFNRAPDRVESPGAAIAGGFDAPELILHAPAQLGFTLAGHERTLDFTYGFRAGAELPGRTTGAVFRVTALVPGEATPRLLFERLLDPAAHTADRGEQRTNLDLPSLPPATRLHLDIDPAGSPAWDWTYVSSLRLG